MIKNLPHKKIPCIGKPMMLRGTGTRMCMAFFLLLSLTWAGLFSSSVGVTMAATASSVPPIPTKLTEQSVPLAPYLEYFVDETGTLSVQDIQLPEVQKQFKPYNLSDITQDFGVLWLRFTLAASGSASQASNTYLLDMGSDLTENAQLFFGQQSAAAPQISPQISPLASSSSGAPVTNWQEYSPSSNGIFLMPENQPYALSAYVRLEGLPGMWFSPALRTPHNAATSWELLAKPAAIVALFVVMLLCVLRGITGKGQWRYWAGLYTGVVLFYAMVGIPVSATGHIPMAHLAAVLAPGVALILLPHVARHIMNTPQCSRAIDMQYRALTLVGVIVALLPLVPGFAFTMRSLELWPLLTLCFVPTTLAAWMSGYEGSRRFLLACLLPPLAVALALLGLLEPVGFGLVPAGALAALPLWGIALGSLILAGTATPSHLLEEERSIVDTSLPTVESLVHSDPNLRLVPVEEAQSLESEHDVEEGTAPKKVISPLEEQLRWPVEQLSRDVASLEACALPVAARENIASLTSVAREISNILHAPAKERMSAPSMGGIEEHIFDLQSLLRQAHDYVSPVADKKNIALSWFMPPHLAQCYKGDAMQLLFVLRLLLESAVRSTHRGAVQLAVRRVPESVNPGHLLFTVTDTGTGKPPQERSVTALARAWELSASYHGFLGVECNAYGASISFTVNYEVSTAASREAAEHVQDAVKKRPIILLSDNTEERHMWGFFLEKIAHPVAEARNADEALDVYKNHSAALIILDARMPMQQMEQIMRFLQQKSQETGEKAPECMAIYAQDVTVVQAEALFDEMGFAHLMALPVTRQSLYTQVEEILAQQADTDLRYAATEQDMGQDMEQDEEPNAFMSHESIPHENITDDLFADTLLQEQTASNESYESQEPHADEEEEEIIDTGLPILDLHAPEPSPSGTAGASLSDGILLINTDATPENAQAAETHVQESFGSMDEHEARHIDDVLQSAEAPFMAEAQASAHPLSTRPAPTEDKSNAAYLTSLLDLGDPAISMVPEEEGQHAPLADDAATFDEAQPQTEAQVEPPQDMGLNAQSEEELLQSINDLINTMEVPPAPSQELDIAEQDSSLGATRPVVRLRSESMRKPKGKVPFERRAVSPMGGGGDWVGEPMPMTSKPNAAAHEAHEDAPEQATPAGLWNIGNAAGQSHAAMDKGQSADAPKAPVKSLAEDLVEVLAEAKQEINTQLARDTSFMKAQESAQSAHLRTGATPKSPLDMLGDGDWVGEPMPIATKVQEDADLPLSVQDDPLSMTPLGATAEDALPELNFHRDEMGEKRGREELGYLKKYLNKFQRKQEKNAPTQPASPLQSEWVGEAMPVSAPATVKNDAESFADRAKADYARADHDSPDHVREEEAPMSQAPSSSAKVRKALDDKAIHEAAPSIFAKEKAVSIPEPEELQEVQETLNAPEVLDVQAFEEPQEYHEPQDSQDSGALPSAPENVAQETLTQEALAEEAIEEILDELMAEAGQGVDFAQDNVHVEEQEEPTIALTPIDELLQNLDSQLAETKDHLAAQRLRGVESAAAAMAMSAEDFGLRTLGRLARTVEAAAKAEDTEALVDLLPELDMSVQRNKAALQG